MDENIRKQLRRQGNIQGGAMLIYSGVMYMCVFLVLTVALLMLALSELFAGGTDLQMPAYSFDAYLQQAMQIGNWGYLLAVVTCFLILLLWKKPAYLRQVVLAPGRAMGRLDFLQLCVVFLAGQQIFSWWYLLMDAVASGVGISLDALLESATVDTKDLPMFLYACMLGPVAEELLFRGLVLRSLEGYGKRFAIVVSALLFALIHGNLLQLPFAFLTGLVLGYVALEHHFGWAVLLHMLNNLVMADLLPRLLSLLPQGAGDGILTAFILFCAVAAAVILLLRRRDIQDYWRSHGSEKGTYAAFFRAPAMVIYLIISVLSLLALPLLALV